MGKTFELVELSLDQHGEDVLIFFNENRDFFEAFENAVPDMNLIKHTFISVPTGVPRENKLVLGCRKNSKLVAFAEFIKDRHRKDEWLLSLLLLDKKLRKTILGGKILLTIFDYIKASGAKAVVGGVVEGNKVARDFWLSIGAESTDVVYNQTLNGKSIPTRVMYKTL